MEIRQFTTGDRVTDTKIATNKPAKLTPGHMDFPLLFSVLAISLFGLIMLFSASYYYGQIQYGNPYFFITKQIIYFLIGLASMLLIANFKSYQLLRKYSLLIFSAAIVLLGLTLIIGTEANGATRWIAIGGVSVQPAEFAKYALVILMATFMAKNPNRMKSFLKGVLPMLVATGMVCGLIMLQPNMSMALIICVVVVIMLYLGGAKMWHLLLLGVAAVAVFFVSSLVRDYRVERINSFLNPWADPLDTGYQTIQSMYAFASGGIFGTGLNFSKQKLLFLTYSESDYIFAIIGEELGFVGAVGLIALYLFIIYRGIRIAARCKDRFGSLLASGVTVVLVVQILLNMGVATGSTPATGQTLPFISSGGTSLVICLIAVGILLNISKNTE